MHKRPRRILTRSRCVEIPFTENIPRRVHSRPAVDFVSAPTKIAKFVYVELKNPTRVMTQKPTCETSVSWSIRRTRQLNSRIHQSSCIQFSCDLFLDPHSTHNFYQITYETIKNCDKILKIRQLFYQSEIQ